MPGKRSQRRTAVDHVAEPGISTSTSSSAGEQQQRQRQLFELAVGMQKASAARSDADQHQQQLALQVRERIAAFAAGDLIEAEVTMISPSSTMAAPAAASDRSSRRAAARAPGRLTAMATLAHAAQPLHRVPRTLRRGARSRETCRGSRRPATAAPSRRAAPARAACATAGSRLWRSNRRRSSRQRGAERVRVAADQQRVRAPCRRSGAQRREVLSLALAAGDQQQRPGKPRPPPAWRRHWCPWNHRRSARQRSRPPTACGAASPGNSRSVSSMAARGSPSASAERQRGERIGGVVQAGELEARRAPAALAVPPASHVAIRVPHPAR